MLLLIRIRGGGEGWPYKIVRGEEDRDEGKKEGGREKGEEEEEAGREEGGRGRGMCILDKTLIWQR